MSFFLTLAFFRIIVFGNFVAYKKAIHFYSMFASKATTIAGIFIAIYSIIPNTTHVFFYIITKIHL